MALPATTVFEVRTGGDDSNGGGFDSAGTGTDYSLQTSPQATFNGTTVTATTAGTSSTITLTGYTVATTDQGNLVNITGGTNFTAGRYRIASVNTGLNQWTLDRNCTSGAGTGMAGRMGGCLLSPSIAAGAATLSGMLVYVKNGTYSITTASTNTAGGCLNTTAGVMFIGYGSNRSYGNTDTRPIFQLSSVSSATIASAGVYYNIEFDGANQSTSKFGTSVNPVFVFCVFRNFTSANSGTCIRCYGTGCSATIYGSAAYACEATGNTATPFNVGSGASITRCIAWNNTGATTNGFTIGAGHLSGCVAYGNGQHGFAGGTTSLMVNCIAENNTGRGFSGGSLINCSAYNNTAGATTGLISTLGFITVTAGSVFTNAGSNDFTLNNTANQGALLRAASYPPTLQNAGSVDFLDIGALQHSETSVIRIGIYEPLAIT